MRAMQFILTLVLCLPTFLLYYFDFALNHGAAALIANLCFIALMSYSLTGLLGKIDSFFLRTLSSYIVFTLVAVYLFAVLVSYYLQGSYLNQQFFFHARLSTVTQAWPVARPLLILGISWLVVLWFCLWLMARQSIRQHAPSGTTAPLLALLALLVVAPLIDPDIRAASIAGGRSLLNSQPLALDLIDWEELQLDPLALNNNVASAMPGKNLLMIYLEGLERLYMDETVFPGLTPNISVLNEAGWQQLDMEQTTGGAWTMGGIVSSLCGTPLVYESEVGGNDVLFSKLLDRATCLPDVLHGAGYQQVFMGGASTEFAGKGNFLSHHSFDEVLGREELLPRLPDEIARNSWGIYDESLFSLALEEFERLAATNQPFNLTMLTVDTHHPIGEPSPNCPLYPLSENSILQSVHCTDYLLNQFLTQIQTVPAYQDTVVILMSDHLAMRNSAFSLFPEEYQRRLYFNVLNSPQQNNSQFTSTAMDIAPTVLDLLGVSHQTHFLAGRSLLAADTASRDVVFQHPVRTNTIRQLNSNFLSSNFDIIYQLDASSMEQLDFINQIAEVNYSSASMEFNSLGNDPYFLLPEIPRSADGDLEIYIELNVSQDTAVTVFYNSEDDNGFSEQRQINRYIEAGENTVFFNLDKDLEVRHLRVDPGHFPGKYFIRKLEIRS